MAIEKRRLALLEQQAAALGWRVDPAINMEITDLRAKIAEAEEVLKPPKQLSKEIWGGMSSDERMEYTTMLVLQLNADFETFYVKVRTQVRRALILLIAFEALRTVLDWYIVRGGV